MAVTLTWIRDNFDANKSRYIEADEFDAAKSKWSTGAITMDQLSAVLTAHNNQTQLPEYGVTPPGNETRPITLEEGKSYPIQISLIGYDTIDATIRVSATGVTCTSGPCTSLPGVVPKVDASGWTVSVHLKASAAATNRCAWIAGKDTSRVAFITEMVLAYSNLVDIGFSPSATEISNAVLIYANLGTSSSLWGC